MIFLPKDIKLFWDEFYAVDAKYERHMFEFITRFENSNSREYAHHGFVRRLGILQRCIKNVFYLYAPERSDIPSREIILDITISLQSFIFNVFGCVDNLAWIWQLEKSPIDVTHERDRKLINLHNKTFRKSLSPEFRQYLLSIKPWFDYLDDFRHALAHRIPLYIPPYAVLTKNGDHYNKLEIQKTDAINRKAFEEYHKLDAKQEALGTFSPVMTHSYSESKGVVGFHVRVLGDFNTIAKIADEFLAQKNW